MTDKSSNLQSLLMRARGEIRMSQCTVCGRHGYNPNPDCSNCVDRLALENDLLSFPVETAADPTESDPAIFARAVVAGVARWEFFSGSEDAGEVCVGGLRYATRLFAGTPILGPLLRESLERHACWKKGAVKSTCSGDSNG